MQQRDRLPFSATRELRRESGKVSFKLFDTARADVERTCMRTHSCAPYPIILSYLGLKTARARRLIMI
jgi:hypothetical protein